MDRAKRTKLEGTGWCVGTAADFLGLSDSESSYVDFELTLSRELKERRQGEGCLKFSSLGSLARVQSHVAKMEASDSSVLVDLLIGA